MDVFVAIGRVARAVRPPKPRKTYAETPDCVAARLRCERQIAVNKSLTRQIKKNEKKLRAQRKELGLDW